MLDAVGAVYAQHSVVHHINCPIIYQEAQFDFAPGRPCGSGRVPSLGQPSCSPSAAAGASAQWRCSPTPAGRAAAGPIHPTHSTHDACLWFKAGTLSGHVQCTPWWRLATLSARCQSDCDRSGLLGKHLPVACYLMTASPTVCRKGPCCTLCCT